VGFGQDVLWDYIPKQRKVVDLPAVDAKCWTDEAKLQLQAHAITHFIGTWEEEEEEDDDDGGGGDNDHHHHDHDDDITVAVVMTMPMPAGSGHFGSVHAGFTRETSESVAIKIINKENVMSLTDMIGVEQEIRALKCLSQHPNIVRLMDVINAPNHVIIVTPYMSRQVTGHSRAEIEANMCHQGRVRKLPGCTSSDLSQVAKVTALIRSSSILMCLLWVMQGQPVPVYGGVRPDPRPGDPPPYDRRPQRHQLHPQPQLLPPVSFRTWT
jgi:hypothetical protein